MHKLHTIRRRAAKSDLVRHNAVFFVGTMGIALFNYLYYPVIGRIVNVADFGEIQAVISLFMQLGIILTAFGYVVTNIVNNADGDDRRAVLVQLERIMIAVSFVGLIVLYVASFLFKDSFKFSSILPIILVGLLILVNVPSTSRAYILQGMKRLKEVSIAGIMYAAGKLIVSVGLIFWLTNDIVAAMLGYIIAQVAMLLYVDYKTKGYYVSILDSMLFARRISVQHQKRQFVRNEVTYGIIVAIILSGLTLLYSSDTILARLFFEPYELGLYSAASAVARMIFFVTASVAGVLVATVKLSATTAVNIRTLLKSFIILALIGGVGVLTFTVLPDLSLRLLVGRDYMPAAAMLPLLAIVMYVCSINNLLAIYQIALRRYWTVVPVLVGVVTLGAGLLVFHESFMQFILVLLAANAVVGILLVVQIAIESKKGNQND